MWCKIIEKVQRPLQKLYKCREVCLISRRNQVFRYCCFAREKSTKMSSDTTEIKLQLKDIFNAGIKAVLPYNVIKNKVKIDGNMLTVGRDKIRLRQNIYLVGFGKAVMSMAIALEEKLGDRLKQGIISVPKGSKDTILEDESLGNFPKLKGNIEYREGAANNQPDKDSMQTTYDILELVETLDENDTLIVLISGGGSALFYMPRAQISPEEKKQLCIKLQNAGANIRELNTVRSKLSLVKGGGLAKLAFPASVISLIFSDIVGDPMELIASGPTVYSSKSPEEVTFILKEYEIMETLGKDVTSLVTSEEPKENLLLINNGYNHVHNFIVGNNLLALESAKLEGLKMGFNPIIIRSDIEGDVHEVSLAYARAAYFTCSAMEGSVNKRTLLEKIEKDPSFFPFDISIASEIYDNLEEYPDGEILLLGGGEPTVKVKGKGKGGRNMELALYFSLDWLAMIKAFPVLSKFEVIILSAGTDGQDGPTDAAGAFGYPSIAPTILNLKERLKKLQDLKNNTAKNINVTTPQNSFLKNIPENLDSIEKQIDNLIPENVLRENDTYNFYSRFKKGEDLLKTGLTGTNVMDIHLVLIRKRACGCWDDYEEESKCPDPFAKHDLHSDLIDSENPCEEEPLNKSLEILDIQIEEASETPPDITG